MPKRVCAAQICAAIGTSAVDLKTVHPSGVENYNIEEVEPPLKQHCLQVQLKT